MGCPFACTQTTDLRMRDRPVERTVSRRVRVGAMRRALFLVIAAVFVIFEPGGELKLPNGFTFVAKP
jgi:hypothetical protein